VTFKARNVGSTQHELLVLKTNLPEGGLPTLADGSVDVTGTGVEQVGKVDTVAAGGNAETTIDLAAGSYVLICNLVQTTNGQTVSHYAAGMHKAFTVTQ
jgi:hypothetical protein